MKTAIAEQVSWLPNWFITTTEDIFSSEQSIRDRFKDYIADTGYQTKEGYENQIDDVLKALERLKFGLLDDTDDSQDKLFKLLEKWRRKVLEATFSSETEALELQRDFNVQELIEAGATQKQLADLEEYYNIQRLEIRKKYNKSIETINKSHAKGTIEIVKGDLALRRLTNDEFEAAQRDLLKQRLELASKTLSNITSVVDESFKREVTIEQNKTTALNNELKKRLLNENLSAEERKKIQNQIAKNDEALRVKQAKIEEKAFNTNKALQIAQGVVNTYAAALGVLKDTNGGTFARFAGMFATITTGLAQVAIIAKQKFQASAASAPGVVMTDGGATSGANAAPDFNIVGQSGSNQLARAVSGQLNKPVKAYVVSKDVSTAQEMDRNVIGSASLG